MNSGSCQFFICNTRIPEWDGRYTVFAHLVGEASYETLDKLMSAEVGKDGRPLKRIYLRGIRIEDAPFQDIPTMLLSPDAAGP
jgi:cyclophilin family peptidyl-prolyl cis-trans isomerase